MEDRSFRCSFDLVWVNLAVTGGLGTGDWSVWVRVLSFLCEEFGEMDLAASCKDKLAYFRIKELKDVLTQLGLPKQGKKQDLMDRILALLSNEQVSKSHGWGKKSSIGKEGVAKIIDDTYRKMQAPGATDLASKSHSSSDLNNGKPKEELNDSYNSNMKVCCPCGSTLGSDSMIKCDNPNCKVWQHIGCVIIPEKPIDGVQPEVPPQFYCAVCRINKADPFWVTMGHPLPPVKLTSSGISSDGTSTVQSVERTFNLTRADRERLQRPEFDLQVWCLLLNDKVQFRMQWPQYADLQVNGVAIRTTNRPGSQSLGINGRDDGPVITTCSREGINKICLSRCDARTFCFGIRIAKRLTVQQVLDMVPKEAEGERFEDALARVCRCISGGAATENADSDSDLEVVADNVPVSLRCPMSGSRMRVAGRFKPCIHMGCFDLETFVELNQRSRKWQCPICLKNYSLENVIIDPYFNRITSLLRNCGEDVNEIEMRPDGSWRAKNEGECRDVFRWHLPDGSLCDSKNVEVKPNLERPIKQEGSSEGYTGLKLGIKRNREGKWEVSKPDGMRYPSPGNLVPENFENHYQNILPMSSSATGSYRDGEDPSVNQDGGGHFDFSVNNGHELDSLPANFDPYIDDRMPSVPQKDTDIIVLSDSEENITIISPYDTGPAGGSEIPFSINHPGVSERYFDDTGLGTSRLDIFDKNNDHFEAPLWPPTMTTTPGFQLFQTGADPPDTLVGAEGSLACAPTSGFDLASDGGLGTAPDIQNGLSHHSDTDMNGSLVDNPLAFGSDDPSLQIFLPSRPAAAPLHDDVRDHAEMPNGVHSDDWISLTLAAGGGHTDSAPPNGSSTSQHFTQKDSRMESLADTASLLLSMNDDRPNRTSNGQRADNSFLHPHQPRSVKPRFVLSIDTDSD